MSFEENMRYDYNLNSRSLVFDIGGYEGSFANKIYNKFGCNVWVFEPIFPIKEYGSIKVFPFGLSDSTREDKMMSNNDSSSLYGESCSVPVQMVDIDDFIRSRNVKKIDLIKINIEGEEYDLLNRMLENIEIYENIQIQFHQFMDNSEQMRTDIRNKLSKTHDCKWCYDWIWESWTKK